MTSAPVAVCTCRRFAPAHAGDRCPRHPPATYHEFAAEDGRPDSALYCLWVEWFARHGVTDLGQVSMTGWVVRNVEARQLVVLELWAPTDLVSPAAVAYRSCHGTALYRARVIQLDREPEPFPVVAKSRRHGYATTACEEGRHGVCGEHCPFDGEGCGCSCHWPLPDSQQVS